MNDVYVVTQGQYSDYSIKAVCSTRENAEEFIRHMDSDWDTPHIETWALDGAINQHRNGMTWFLVRMDRDGNATEVAKKDWDYVERGGLHNGFDVQCRLMTYTWARDEKHAIKIANERRTMLIANNIWRSDLTTAREHNLALKRGTDK